ncbi:DUF6177 family protein [Clavibacter michiganensis]|nr:DUF6177 family protein [Clavibacter michiganensis]
MRDTEMDETRAAVADPMLHPLIDEQGDGYVVCRTAARVLHLSGLRAGLLADTGAAGSRVLVITPEDTRLTFASLEALRSFGGRWAVPSGGGLRLAGTTAVVAHPREAFGSRIREGGPTPPAPGSVPWTQITVTARHVLTGEFEVGSIAELIAAEAQARVDAWGVVEPAVSAFSPAGVTAWSRSRLPRTVRLLLHGDGLSGSIRVWSEPAAVFEETKLVVRGELSTTRSAELLRRLQRAAQIQFAFVCSMHGAPDMTFTADVPAPVEPRAALVGPRAVRDNDFPTAELEQAALVERIGHPRTPSLLMSFGGGEAAAWADLATTARHLGPETIAAAFSGRPS